MGRWAVRLLPPLLYLAAATYLYSDFLAHPRTAAPGGADSVVYSWFFEWTKDAVFHLYNPLFTDRMNAPTGVNSMWNGGLLVFAVLLSPLTASIGPTATVGLLMYLAPVASATTAYLVFLRLTGRAPGAAVGAALYGFGPFFVGQAGHVHLTMAVLPPLLLLLGHDLVVAGRGSPRRIGLELGLAVALTLLFGEELVAMSALLAVIALLYLAVLHPRGVRARVRRVGEAAGYALATVVVIAGLPIAYQFAGPLALRQGVPASEMRLDLRGLVVPSDLMYYSTRADRLLNHTFPPNGVENTGYLGWPLLVLLVGLWAWLLLTRDPFAPWWGLTTVTAVIISMGTPLTIDGRTYGSGLWALLDQVPVLRGAVIVRFTLITTLLAGLLIATALARLHGRVLAFAVVVVLATFIPLRPAHKAEGIYDIATPRFFSTAAVHTLPTGSTALLLPQAQTPQAQSRVMTWQLAAGLRFRIIGGYGIFDVDGAMSYFPTVPAYAALLIDAGQSGTAPSAEEIAAARPSIGASGSDEIVVTDYQANRSLVMDLAAQLSGCTFRRVVDVDLCVVPH